ncbi:MAG TPA: RNA polymerase sigma factor RpoH [bacterium]|nr:RNA polymerase sigma factor RpoH [bacterium]
MSRLPVPQGSLSSYLTEINRFPLLSPEEEFRLAVRYREDGDVEAAHRLVTSNLRFVVKVAYEYRSYGMRMSDLIQEGNIGLMTAVKKFDPHKGYRLISYAVWWIRAMIQSYILKSWSLVKIGTTQAQRKLFYKLSQTKRALARLMSGGGQETLDDAGRGIVAKALHVSDRDVEEMDARMSGRDASLDAPLREDGQTTALDLLAAADNQEDDVARAEEESKVRDDVRSAMTTLNDKERYIVEKRLMTDEPMTLQEIGDHYKISRERARQLEERAKKKIRAVLTASGFSSEVSGELR